MSGRGNSPPVIVRRQRARLAPPGHNGGWKVAYADFVTAMMAFFLLMWLINTVDEDKRKGISDYFSDRVPLVRVPGTGASLLYGETIGTERTAAQQDAGGASPAPDAPEGAAGGDDTGAPAAGEADDAQRSAEQRLVEEQLFDRGGESRTMERLLRHVITRVTDEGLVIELFDHDGAALFQGETAEPAAATRALIPIIAEVIALTANRLAVGAHVRGQAVIVRSDLPWNLTGARAQIIRQLLEEAGVPAARIERVTGYSDRRPAVANRAAIRNNRIEIVLLRHDR